MAVHSMLNEESELLQKRPLKDDVFESVHEKIISGKYQPGAWLRQEDIATQLGVSMTPVREALDLLVSAGLVERVPYRGVRVPKPSHEEIAESYAIRLLLEKAVSRAAAVNRDQDHVDALRRIVNKTKKLIKLDDMSESRKLSVRFHMLIVDAAKNSMLKRVYQTVVNIFPDWMLYQAMFTHPEALEETTRDEYREHLAMVDAIESGDADLAERQAVEHIHDIGRQLVLYLGVSQELLDRKTEHLGL